MAREAPQGRGEARIAVVGDLLQCPAGHLGRWLTGGAPAGRFRLRGYDPDLEVRDPVAEGIEDRGTEVAQPFGPRSGIRVEDGAAFPKIGQADVWRGRRRQGGPQDLVSACQTLGPIGDTIVGKKIIKRFRLSHFVTHVLAVWPYRLQDDNRQAPIKGFRP